MDAEDEAAATKEVGIEDTDVQAKYKAAAEIANAAMDAVKQALAPGSSVAALCALGDSTMTAMTEKIYSKPVVDKASGQKVKVEKGIAFPTNIAPNNVACHLSPLDGEDMVLKAGDLVKVDLGCHVDGQVATLALTMVVPQAAGEAPEALTGAASDVVRATYAAADAVLRLMRPGKTNEEVSDVIARVAKDFGVNVVEGVLSHQMKQFVIDGNKVILAKPTPEQRVEKIEFAENEVYAIDIAMSTGEGKPKETGSRTTIFKRRADVEYSLKLKTSRQVISEIDNKFQFFPFVLRALSDEKRGKLGISEALKHEMVIGYPVLYEKEGALIARAKFTVFILPKYSLRITTFDTPPVQDSEKQIEDQLVKDLLALSVGKPEKKKK
ncbi:ERBB-3 Binding protein 1 [Porphyridium purpureum]|uniref:ERBB-3 Binding protein 1 n=1 Tax=Porphyridium purpureum TaxID=35688 RepID=A0A5J4Z4I9_PORPP|nr:ERBB-3 Binding protein 1 [Porphyridium purpureum]|eukprot:POR3957..scf295_1